MGVPQNSGDSNGMHSTTHNGTVGGTDKGANREPGITNTRGDTDRNELVGKKWAGGTRRDRARHHRRGARQASLVLNNPRTQDRTELIHSRARGDGNGS